MTREEYSAFIAKVAPENARYILSYWRQRF